jgi:hypothetical protein
MLSLFASMLLSLDSRISLKIFVLALGINAHTINATSQVSPKVNGPAAIRIRKKTAELRASFEPFRV